MFGRLAVDRKHHRHGLGAAPLKHVIVESLEVSHITGVRHLLVHAKTPTPSYGDEVAVATLELARSYDDETIRVLGMFGPVVAAPLAAAAIDRVGGFLGRCPRIGDPARRRTRRAP